MLNIVGHCPKCGAPIYAPSMWHGITPPPSQYSCACNFNGGVRYNRGIDGVIAWAPIEGNEEYLNNESS